MATGRKAKPIYRVAIANPKERDEKMSKFNVGLMTYNERRIMQESDNVIKSGSDHAFECSTRIGADDTKKNTAQVVVKNLRPAVKYTAEAKRPRFMPKRMAFRKRAD
jgi:hypothetical protein